MRRNTDKVRAAIEAFNRRDGESFDTLLADDATIVPARAALEGTTYEGPDAATKYIASIDAHWDDMTWEVEEIRDCGDRVIALGRIRGCGRDTGAPFEATAGWIAHFRDGLVTRFHTHGDRARALEAVGMK